MVKFRARVGEKDFELDINGDCKIIEAKAQLESISGLSVSNQKWIYQGRILVDDFTVTSAGIVDGHAIHVLKSGGSTATAAAPSVSAAATSSLPAHSPVVPSMSPHNQPVMLTSVPPSQLTRAFDDAMKRILMNNEDAVKAVVALYLKIVINIIDHPSEEKYRRIKSSNAAFSTKVVAIAGGLDCMRAMGFAEVNGEWILHPSEVGWNLLIYVKKKLELFTERLNNVSGSSANVETGSPAAASAAAPAVPLLPPMDPTNNIQALQELLRGFMTLQQQRPPDSNPP